MEILPKNLGTRPRLAVEVRPEGIVAARAEDATALLTATADHPLPEGAFVPGLKAGFFADSPRVIAGLRETLDSISSRGERVRYVTLIVPDASTRVLLLEFDELPAKATEALPIVRFRLKKLVPFDAEHAMVSYQVMSSGNRMVRVLAVAMPSEVLAEYENAVSAAGYVTGAVLPSTLAALAAIDEQVDPVLLVNACRDSITTAIVREGTLILHRALELYSGTPEPVAVPAMYGAEDMDRIEAEMQIESEVLETSAREHMDAREIVQSVSVAAAYFEDTLGIIPGEAISAGTLGAENLKALLNSNGMEHLSVREAVGIDALAAGTRVPRSWLAGVRGALRN